MTAPTIRKTQRVKLRNLDLSQKLLIWTVLLTVGGGYLGALANLFVASAPADGKQTLRLEQFISTFRAQGISGLITEINNSMGMEDVIKRYHGQPGVTKMETSLKGVMAPILVDEIGEDETKRLTLEISQWALLPPALRKAAYEVGVPMNADDGTLQFDKLREFFTDDGERRDPDSEVELVALSGTFNDSCVYCHASDSTDARARKIPLQTYDQVASFCTEDRGIPVDKLALTTHVHLLGFSMLFAMTGFLFSMTDWPLVLRSLFAPWTLLLQVAEIACWWLAKHDVFYAKAIFFLGFLIGAGLLIQILGTALDLIFRRPERVAMEEGPGSVQTKATQKRK